LSLPVDNACTEHEIAHRSGIRTTRPGQSGGDRAANGAVFRKMRRFKRQHLTMLCQQRFYIAQRRTGAGSNHQFSRIIGQYALPRAHVQCFAFDGAAIPGFRIPAAYRQWLTARCRIAYLFCQRRKLLSGLRHVRNHPQKRGSSGKRN